MMTYIQDPKEGRTMRNALIAAIVSAVVASTTKTRTE
jgi:hypothetical protein